MYLLLFCKIHYKQFLYIFREQQLLHRNIERVTSEYQEAKEKCEEMRQARQDAVRELLALQDQHQEEVQLIRSDLQDEASSREGMDRRINDLRAEVCFNFVCNLLFGLITLFIDK